MFPFKPLSFEDFKAYSLEIAPGQLEWELKLTYKYYLAQLEGTQKEINKSYDSLIINLRKYLSGELN